MTLESKYSYSVIQRNADHKFNVRANEWGGIFEARRFMGLTDEQEKLINAAFKDIEKHTEKFKREDYRVCKGGAVFTFTALDVPEAFEPEEIFP